MHRCLLKQCKFSQWEFSGVRRLNYLVLCTFFIWIHIFHSSICISFLIYGFSILSPDYKSEVTQNPRLPANFHYGFHPSSHSNTSTTLVHVTKMIPCKKLVNTCTNLSELMTNFIITYKSSVISSLAICIYSLLG